MRRRLWLLVLAALLPLLALIAGLTLWSVRQQQGAMRAETVRAAEQILAGVEQELATQIALLRVLARSPSLAADPPDLTAFRADASRFQQTLPLWSRVILVSREAKQVANTGVPEGAPLPPIVDEESFRRLLVRKAAVIGNLAGPGALANDEPKVGLRVPVLRDDEVRYALTVTLSPKRLGELVAQAGLDPTWLPFLVDGADRVVAHPRMPERVGRPVAERTRIARQSEDAGLYEGVTPNGIATVSAYRKSRETGWSAHVSIPRAVYEAPLVRSLWLLAVAACGALGLSGAFAWLLRQEVLTSRHEQRLHERATRMEALGRMTGGVAHDFNNLLMVILGNLEILQKRAGALPQVERYVTAARKAAERGTHLTRELLSFTRGEARQAEVVDLGERLRSLEAMLRQSLRGDITIVLDLPRDPLRVRVDPIQLDLAVLNVAVNARDAMPDGGTLTVRLARSALPGQAGRKGVELTMSDTGGGVSAEALPHVFEPFFTTKEVGKGTGLGLSQVYGFAKQSGGMADIASRVGVGTCVRLYLPEAEAVAGIRDTDAVATAAGSAPVTARVAARIVLVDDNEEVRAVTAEFLAAAGFEVRAVASPQVALTLLTEDMPDVLVSDIVMPGPMDGYALAKTVRHRWPSLPILLVSGYSNSIEAARSDGFTVLAKPFAAEQLIAAIRSRLAGSSASTSGLRSLGG